MHVTDRGQNLGVVRQARARDAKLTQRRRVVAMAPVVDITQREVRFGQIRLQRERPLGVGPGVVDGRALVSTPYQCR